MSMADSLRPPKTEFRSVHDGSGRVLCIAVAVVAVSLTSLAGSVGASSEAGLPASDFKCVIHHVSTLAPDGSFQEFGGAIGKWLLGRDFVVDRSTGKKLGAGYTTDIEKPVVSDGLPINHYQVVYYVGQTVSGYLQIWPRADWGAYPKPSKPTNDRKPFLEVQSNVITTGECGPYP